MYDELKKIDYSFAYEIEEAKTNSEVCSVVEQALIRFGLVETARQMKRRMIK